MEGKKEIDGAKEKPASTSFSLHWSQWQLIDSILPTGGFAHSFGIEAAIQARVILNPEDFQTYVIHVLENTGSLLLPYVYSAAMCPDLDNWRKLDRMLDATLTNEVSRKASVSQGSALMRVAAAVFTEIPSLKIMREMSLGSGIVAFHHAPVFGIVCGLLGMDSETSQRAYMFITMRDAFSAATRLNLVGPLGAAVLQHQVSIAAETMLKRWMNREVEDAWYKQITAESSCLQTCSSMHTHFHIKNRNRLVTYCELVKNSVAFWLLTMELVDFASSILEKLYAPRRC
ncbi:urease accessory protein UreF [Populus alba x Populus x berolinensis]|nr:urease accessory protein UreF [Populus alba x Populus x berolinensis]